MFSTSNQRWNLGGVGIILVLLVILLQKVHHPLTPKSFSLSSLGRLGGGKITQAPTIPNIVHFVHLMRGSDKEPTLEFPFRQFIAIYSAQYYLNPETIYIHTNIENHLVEAALNAATSPYSRVLRRMSNVVFNHETPRLRTSEGKDVVNLGHRSDLMRTRILKKWGGLYLDEDSYVVRDLQPLRDSGFKTVLGKESDAKTSNVVMLAAPESDLISAFELLQEESYNGWGTAHSMDLLNRLARDFSGLDNQALVLMREAFFPIGFKKDDLVDFYHIYKSQDLVTGPTYSGEPIISCSQCQNATDYVDQYEEEDDQVRNSRVDWRGSYVLHGWNTALMGFDRDGDMFGSRGGVTLEYVLARKSRFASAVYPAIKHAVDTGVLDGTADELAESG